MASNNSDSTTMNTAQLRSALHRVDRQKSYAWALKYKADEAVQRANQIKMAALIGLCLSLCVNAMLVMSR